MVDVPLYGGPLKRTLIQRAFGLCGQSSTEYELTAEEYELGLQVANDLAASTGITTWNAPSTGDGYAAEESGLPQEDVQGFIALMAQELGPNIGKPFAPNARQASAASSLIAKYRTIPYMEMGRGTIRGSGNRWWPQVPFFATDVAADEPAQ